MYITYLFLLRSFNIRWSIRIIEFLASNKIRIVKCPTAGSYESSRGPKYILFSSNYRGFLGGVGGDQAFSSVYEVFRIIEVRNYRVTAVYTDARRIFDGMFTARSMSAINYNTRRLLFNFEIFPYVPYGFVCTRIIKCNNKT